MKTPRSGALMCAFFFASMMSILAQGPLAPPPGPPAPTMKTLQQIEPRTDLQATPAPPGVDTTNANYQFIINQPGSYYLSANLGVTKANGIQINAEGVTLDLNGFEVSRTSGAGGTGIEISATSHRARVRNGSVKGFALGVTGSGAPHACILRDLVVTGCSSTAIAAIGTVFESCVVHDNSGTAGISANDSSLTNCIAYNNSVTNGINANGCSLTNCVAFANSGTVGISAFRSSLTNCTVYNNSVINGITANGCSLINCNASANSGAATFSAGINATACTLTHCVANDNATTLGSLSNTTGMGFQIGGSTIQDCTAAENKGDGIRVLGPSIVRDNLSAFNGSGSGANGAGINVAALSGSRIDSNNVNGNTRGIEVNSTGNVIVRNTAGNNTTNYSIVAGNHYGPIVDDTDETAINTPAATGNSAAGDLNSSHPWANIAH